MDTIVVQLNVKINTIRAKSASLGYCPTPRSVLGSTDCRASSGYKLAQNIGGVACAEKVFFSK